MEGFAIPLGPGGPFQQAEEPEFTDIQMEARLKEFRDKIVLAEFETFSPGDLVIHRHPEGSSSNYARYPGVFVRYLEDAPLDMVEDVIRRNGLSDISDANHTTAADVLDCVIGIFVPRAGGKVLEFLMNSSHFKTWTPDLVGTPTGEG